MVLKTKRNDPRVSERSYKMKKVIAILLVLLVAGVVFGVDATTSLTLNSYVQASSDLKVSLDAIPSSFGVSDWGSITSTESVDFGDAEGESLTAELNVFMKSNIRAGWTVSVVAPEALSTENAADGTIGYTIKGTAVNGTNDIKLASIAAGNGMRVAAEPFAIVMNSDDWALASADINYTATLTINMVTK